MEGGGGRGAELVRKLEGARWPLPLGAFCTSYSDGLGLSAVCRRRARVPPPDRLEGALTMCLQEADKSEGLPAHQSPAA